MPRQARSLLNNIVCHHMVQGINKEYIFETDNEKEKYLSLLKKYYQEFKIDIIAYCIMDNHVHLLLYASEIQEISDFMKRVNTIYAINYNKIHDRVGYVFRNRFESKPILTREQLYVCIKYIHMNPVKAGIVKEEKEYHYSSYQDYLSQSGFLNQKILNFIFGENTNYEEALKIISSQQTLEEQITKTEEILSEFMKKENISFNRLKNDKILIQKLINYLVLNQIEFPKKQLAELLNISIATLYRRINLAKGGSLK